MEVREGSESHQGGPEGVGRPSQRASRGWDALPEGRGVGRSSQRAGRGQVALSEGGEGSGGHPGGLEGQEGSGCPLRRPEDWEALLSGVYYGGLGVVGSRSRWAGSDLKALPVDWDRLGDPPGGPIGVGRPSHGPGGVVRPFQRARRGWESLS